jgi:hypothetical protein
MIIVFAAITGHLNNINNGYSGGYAGWLRTSIMYATSLVLFGSLFGVLFNPQNSAIDELR